MSTLSANVVLVLLVGVERLCELVVSNRHAREMFRRGGVEHGRGHYPAMVLLHSLFLVGCLVEPFITERRFVPELGLPMRALVVLAQGIRWWAITTLGVRWSTRVIVLPRAPRIVGGPYRYLAHPNYVAVVLEGFALPLVHGSVVTALAFTILNFALLAVRIRTENAALDSADPA